MMAINMLLRLFETPRPVRQDGSLRFRSANVDLGQWHRVNRAPLISVVGRRISMLMGMKNAMSAVSKAFEKAVAFSDVGFLVLGLCPFWKMRHAQRRMYRLGSERG